MTPINPEDIKPLLTALTDILQVNDLLENEYDRHYTRHLCSIMEPFFERYSKQFPAEHERWVEELGDSV